MRTISCMAYFTCLPVKCFDLIFALNSEFALLILFARTIECEDRKKMNKAHDFVVYSSHDFWLLLYIFSQHGDAELNLTSLEAKIHSSLSMLCYTFDDV